MQLFFSRRIGLSDEGGAVPILDGTRLTGRQGAYSVGLGLNMQQRSIGAPLSQLSQRCACAATFWPIPISAPSCSTEQGGPLFNRIAGPDANFRFGDLTGTPTGESFPRSGVPIGKILHDARRGFNRPAPGRDRPAGSGDQGSVRRGQMGYVRAGCPHAWRPVAGGYLRPAISKLGAADAPPIADRRIQAERRWPRYAAIRHFHSPQPAGREHRNRRQPADRSGPGTVHDQQFKRGAGEPRPISSNEYFAFWHTERAHHIVQHPIWHGHVLRR